MALNPPPNPSPTAAPAWVGALDAVSDLVALLDGQGGIVWANAAFSRISGHAPADVLGRQAVALLGPNGAWQRIEQPLREGRPFDRIELPWRHAAGEVRTALASARLLPEAGPARLLLSLQDITETRQLRDEARHKAELLDMTQEFGRFAVWERSIPDGVGHWDRHMFRFFDMQPHEGMPAFDVAAQRIHPADGVSEAYHASTRQAGVYEHRYRILRPDGSVRRVHSRWEVKNSPLGVPERVIGLLVDDTEAYQLADAFNKANAQLKIAVELGNIAIWRHDLKLNRFFYNDHAYKILGLEPREEGLSLDEVRSYIHPDDMPHVLETAERSLHTNEPVDMEARYRRTDGRWVYVLTRRMVHRDENGTPIEFIGVGLDVSTQVEKLREASEMAKRLEIAVRSAGVGVWSRDPDNPRATWNEEMFKITGRPAFLGGPTRDEWIYQIVHPDDRAAILSARAEVSAETMSVEHECRIVRPNGEVRWLVNRARREMRDGVLMVFGVTLDVTERVRAEAALRSVNERVALAARSVGMGTWEWDVSTGEAVWDEAMFRLRGMEPQAQALDAVQRLAMTHPDDVEAVKRELREAAHNTGPTAYEFRVVWPDGTVRWLASRSTPAPDEHGRASRRIGVNWDVTEAKNAEVSRRERELALRESRAKSEFLSRMSHELRTPLNAVLGFAQLLMIGKDALLPQQRGKLAHIQSAGEHLLALIDDVLDLSSLESGQLKLDLQPVPLAEVLHEALPLVDSLARSHGIAIQTGAVDGVLLGDRTRLRQMMINLLSNAIKYNKPNGKVTVSSQVTDTDVSFQVQDTGRGMTADQLAHLFEPFNRLGLEREGIEGTGIGLAVVKALALHMRGEVTVNSQPGRGSTFAVRLPRASDHTQPAAGPAATAPVAAPTAPRRKGTLLYIEDNAVNVLLVEELIRMRPGLVLESAGTGLAGVARAATLQPDLILVDIQLPDIDGFEVLRHLKQQAGTAHIPCIALSANAMPPDIARATAAGFADYWTKPIDFSQFLAALDKRFPAL
ncbi:MAG TPA: PAS domain-containing protein [Rhizobacter sp.]|nr:PAS domain-containing protein [Rhizobacter sp.]